MKIPRSHGRGSDIEGDKHGAGEFEGPPDGPDDTGGGDHGHWEHGLHSAGDGFSGSGGTISDTRGGGGGGGGGFSGASGGGI
ncbi:hypothetical protein AMTR_s00077p00064840 [Amborella trichopoda]|uniref:Uncharacterized protein n=1 Tax=Amborella trichopoda TaxID=13333 RepID=W1PAT4_AMBTC|nr:hypothetical protein AMTR_s00077p00064840 [Amborella trichopoda]